MGSEIVWTGEVIFATSDLYYHPTLTTWLCGCHLKCPFCHNWRIAEWDESMCKRTSIRSATKKIIKEYNKVKNIARVDYLHITGGEPLLQAHNLLELISNVVTVIDTKISVNSSLTTPPKLLESVIDYVQHIAFDVKLPFPIMTGVPASSKLANNFVENLKTIKKNIEFRKKFNIEPLKIEVRVPVAKSITLKSLSYVGSEKLLRLISELGDATEVIVVQPVLGGKMGIEPRVRDWEYLNPSPQEIEGVSRKLEKFFGNDKVRIREDMVKVL